jgi:hypothetical protein
LHPRAHPSRKEEGKGAMPHATRAISALLVVLTLALCDAASGRAHIKVGSSLLCACTATSSTPPGCRGVSRRSFPPRGRSSFGWCSGEIDFDLFCMPVTAAGSDVAPQGRSYAHNGSCYQMVYEHAGEECHLLRSARARSCQPPGTTLGDDDAANLSLV